MKIKIFKYKKSLICIALTMAVFSAMYVIRLNTAFYAFDGTNLPQIETKDDIKSLDDEELFLSAGLAKAAALSMPPDKVAKLAGLICKSEDIEQNYIVYPITSEEKTKNELPPMVPLQKGDVLVSFSTHTLNWRHGHAAIVTEAGYILEHMSLGNTSCISSADSWRKYPNFMVLRCEDSDIAKKAADYAKEKLTDIPYSIFAGLAKKDKSNMESVDSSHCSHIVWLAYKASGIDIDANGGRIVTPKDIAKSDKLKVVQIFGINPKEYKEKLYIGE